jgi:hypothetical protein
MTLEEQGTVRVDGRQLLFTPATTIVERRDSTDPAGDYRRVNTRAAWTSQWTVSGDKLVLSHNGESTTYKRE